MEIRKCRLEDTQAVFELMCELKGKDLQYDNFKNIFTEKLNNIENYFIVATEYGNVIGFLGLNVEWRLTRIQKVATVIALIVNSVYRSKGMGRLLLADAIQYARDSDCETIELTSNFARERAHKFYEHNGFTKNSYKFKMKL